MAYRTRFQSSRRSPILISAVSKFFEQLEQRQLLAAHIVGNPTVYSTIQAAVDAASAGATITVDPGNYVEQIVIGKSLTIKGAQAGVDARSNLRIGASESVVQGITLTDGTVTYAFKIIANDVTLDGFTVQGQSTSTTVTGAGIVIGPNIAGTNILDNIVQNNVSGLYLSNNSATDPALIQHNVFLNNNNAGGNPGRAIYSDGGVSGGLLQNVTIDSNFFYGNLGTPDFQAQPAIGFESYTANSQTKILITNNVFEKNGKAVLCINVSNMTFSGNVVGNHYDTPSGGLRFEGGDSNITITNNNLYGSGAPGIRIDQKAVPNDNFNFVVQNNNIYKNGQDPEGLNAGLWTNTLQYQGSLTATNNYWGASNGPSGLGTGSGDAILNEGSNIIYQPYAASYTVNPQVPWNGLAQNVTGPIEAENFDHGLEGVSYHDTSAGNTAGNYRPYQDVDISTSTDSGGGYYLSSVRTGEWTEYSVNVDVGGTYTGLFRVANSAAGGSFHLEMDGSTQNISGAISVPNTGGSSTWQTINKTGIPLTSGQHILRIIYDTAASSGIVANFNWFQFNLTSATTPAAPSNVVATATGSTTVNLTWQDNSNNETGFIIERMTGSTGVWNSLTTTAANITTYTDTTAAAATSYTYRIRATNANGSSTNATSNQVTTPQGNIVYLSDLQWVGTPTNGWGPVEKDTSNGGQAAGDGNTITLNGVTYTKGLGAHAISDITYNLNGAYTTFLSDIGPDDETGATQGLDFQVFADGVKIYDSGGMAQTDPTQSINVSVAGVQQLRLHLDDLDGDLSYDHGDWAGARLIQALTPPAPTGLTATPISGTQINLAWTDVTGETGYKVMRSTDNLTFTQIGATLAANTVAYNDTSVSGATTYYYKVVATNASGDSPPSNVASTQPVQPPAAPSGLTATPITGAQINLAWTDVATETGYKVMRSTDNVTFTQLGSTLAANTIAYSDTSVSGSTTYYYKIIATNSGGDSQPSNTASSQPLQKPAAPGGLTATAFSGTQINLAWTDVTGETGYKVLRSTNNINFAQIGSTLAANTIAYSDTTVSGSTTYYYQIVATNAAGDSAPSNTASSQPLQPPVAPTNLTGNAIMPTQINLTWTDVANETGYKIERSTDNVTFNQIGTTAANVVSYSDTTVAGSTTYYYRVRATNSAGDSPYSNVQSVTTPTGATAPAAPSNLIATATSSAQINLTWQDNSGNETGFKIERSLDASTNWVSLGTVAANLTTFSDSSGLSPSTTYYYRVRATNLVGDSANSNIANATTQSAPASTQQTWIAAGSVWKYLDNGSNQGASWRATSFNDSAWKSGAAQLGYGDGDETTVVSYGNNPNKKYITTYFRKSFSVADPSLVTALSLELLRDDGAVVYLNGTEIYRNNMPSGTISFNTLASTNIGGADENAWYSSSINPSLLVSGANVIAVEIHQCAKTSDDISFDFKLNATVQNATAPAAPSNLVATAASSSQINLTWTDNANNETGFIVERSPDGVSNWTQIGTPAQNATTFSDTGLNASTTYYYRVRATNSAGPSANSNVANATTQSGSTTNQTFIAAGSVWKYLDNGSNQGTAWRATSFNDSTWKSGAAQLGYGDGDETTVVSYGSDPNNKYVTTYFRASFNVADPSQVTALMMQIVRDDGCVVYLNGTEVYRNNMPTGTISYNTLAVTALGGADESAWNPASITPALLVAGTNVIAVEIHQSDLNSSDISFDFQLAATGNFTSGAMTQTIVMAPTNTTTLSTNTTDETAILA